jgi:alpha 1,2-mannosyltransferase
LEKVSRVVESSAPSETLDPTQNLAQSVLSVQDNGQDISHIRSSRVNAAFVVLSRNSDVWDLAKSIRSVEDRFNHRYGYDWVFLNDVPFDETFKNVTSSIISGEKYYGLVPKEHWSYPDWIDQDRAARVREEAAGQYLYGDSESYRHMCRFFSGFFFRHELLKKYDYYWRVEPEIELLCDINLDPFQFMKDNNKKYSFVISLVELEETIPTLWKTVKSFFTSNPGYLALDNSRSILSDDEGETYNLCHFVSSY